MITLKRKVDTETERERSEGYGTVIELNERKSFAASQKDVEEPEIYSKREDIVKPREEVMPSIKKETKSAPAVKEAVSSKAKVLLAAYIIIAVVLAAVVIGTGLALTEIGNRNTAIIGEIHNYERKIDVQDPVLFMVNEPSYIAGEAAGKYEMEFVDENDIVTVTVVSEVATQKYAATSNWFDKIGDFLSRLFS